VPLSCRLGALRLGLAVATQIVVGLLEGYGLLLLLPLLHPLGFASARSAHGANWVAATVNAAHAPLTLATRSAAVITAKFPNTKSACSPVSASTDERERMAVAVEQDCPLRHESREHECRHNLQSRKPEFGRGKGELRRR
jgi:hypothetical protein